jgi:uncharacterized protein YqeY
MSLKDQLANDLKDAMRARDERRREVLRMAIAAVHNAEIAAGDALDDEAVLGVLGSEAKRRRESIAEFGKAGRTDLVEKEEGELEVLQTYLPEQLSREEIVAAAKRVIEQTGATSMKDLGKVMPALIQELRGRADGRAANEAVRELLGS